MLRIRAQFSEGCGRGLGLTLLDPDEVDALLRDLKEAERTEGETGEVEGEVEATTEERAIEARSTAKGSSNDGG